MRGLNLLLLLVVSTLQLANAFYLPGVAPIEYEKGQKVELKVNKLTSVKTQLPYEYYSLPVCLPAKVEDAVENLGEVLGGDRIENSRYDFRMKHESKCNILCKMSYKDEDMKGKNGYV